MKRTSTMTKAIATVFAFIMIIVANFAPVLANDSIEAHEGEKTEETRRVVSTTDKFELPGAHNTTGTPCGRENHPAMKAHKAEEAVTIVSVEENEDAVVSHEAVVISCNLLHNLF